MAKRLTSNNLVTKNCKPTAFGETKNSAVRNLLGKVSDELFERIDGDYLIHAASYFGFKCPYTDKDISRVLSFDNTDLSADHIIPINKDHLGLTVKGNIILVDKDANNIKRGENIDDFIMKNALYSKDTLKDRKNRLKKIEAFQKEYCYDKKELDVVLKKFIDNYLEELEKFQKKAVDDLKIELYKVNSVVLMKYYEYVKNSALKKDGTHYSHDSCNAYASSIRQLLNTHKATLDDLKDPVKLDDLIKEVRDPKSVYHKSGNTQAALNIFKAFIKTLS